MEANVQTVDIAYESHDLRPSRQTLRILLTSYPIPPSITQHRRFDTLAPALLICRAPVAGVRRRGLAKINPNRPDPGTLGSGGAALFCCPPLPARVTTGGCFTGAQHLLRDVKFLGELAGVVARASRGYRYDRRDLPLPRQTERECRADSAYRARDCPTWPASSRILTNLPFTPSPNQHKTHTVLNTLRADMNPVRSCYF